MSMLGKFAAACAAVVCAFGADAAFTSLSYVQDGLVAQWDGIDNVGIGQHDSSATQWVDLTGNGLDWKIDLAGAEWAECGLELKGTKNVGTMAKNTATAFDGKISTIEFVYINRASQHGIIFCPGYGDKTYLYTDANNRVGFYGPSGGTRYGTTVALNSTNCFSVSYSRADGDVSPTGVSAFYVNGEKKETEGMGDYWSASMSGNIYLGGRNGTPYCKGELLAIRIYDRVLTDDERQQNSKIDSVRFLGVSVDDSLTVSGDPVNFGAVTPAYGRKGELAAEQSFICTAPATVEIAPGNVATCVGYTVTTNGAVYLKGDGNSFTYVHPGVDAKLVWNWEADETYWAGLKGGVINTNGLDEVNFPTEALTRTGYLEPEAGNVRTTAAGNWSTSLDTVWTKNRCWVYWGEMWFDGGVYRFGANLYDRALVKIDGVKVWTSSSGAVSRSGQIRPTRGWHAVEFRFNNGNDANAGPRSTDQTWTLEKGFGVNIGDPELPSAYGHRYTKLVDGGNGSLFRHTAYIGSAVATADPGSVASHTLAFAAGEGGSVTSAGGSCDADKTISVTATPSDGYRFVKWTGDVAYGQTFVATVDVPGNRDRSLTAVFEPDVVRAGKTFVGATNGKWNVPENWDPEGVPGPSDNVVIPASKNVELDVLADIGSLTINNGSCVSANFASGKLASHPREAGNKTDAVDFGILSRGDVTLLGNAKFYLGGIGQKGKCYLSVRGDLSLEGTATALTVYGGKTNGLDRAEFKKGGARVTVGGETRVASGNWIYPWGCSSTGNAVIFDLRKLTVAAGGGFNAVGTGSSGPGFIGFSKTAPCAIETGACGGDGQWGAPHRGNGGESTPAYDFELAPFYPGAGGNSASGGGAVRVNATDIEFAGKIDVQGYSGTMGGSGGSVWITCDTFTAAATANINANGAKSGRGGGGGGGIAIGLRLKPWQIEQLYDRGGCGKILVGTIPEIIPSAFTFSVDRGLGSTTARCGQVGSAVAYMGLDADDAVSLQVLMDIESEVTAAASPACGVSVYEKDETLTDVTMSSPLVFTKDGASRKFVTGYTIVWADGTTTEGSGNTIASLKLTQSATLTWHFDNLEYRVDATTARGASGAVSVNGETGFGWAVPGGSATLTATPDDAEADEFQYWTGDVPYANRYDNPLTVSVDKAKNIMPFFGRKDGGVCVTKDAAGNWYDAATWKDGVVPGTNDTAILLGVGNIRQIYVPDYFSVRNLAVSNDILRVAVTDASMRSTTYGTDLDGNVSYWPATTADKTRVAPIGFDVAGDLLVDKSGVIYTGGSGQIAYTKVNVAGNADILSGVFQIQAGVTITNSFPGVCNDGQHVDYPDLWELFKGGNELNVAGRLHIGASGQLQPLNEYRSGAAMHLVMNDVVIDQGGRLTSYFGGYMSFSWDNVTYVMVPGGYSSGDNKKGGSHGGYGGGQGVGSLNTSTKPYGFETAPFYPGSFGGAGSFRGAGTIRLDCESLTLNGKLIANGAGGNKGGSAGGGIWVNAKTLEVGANAVISAKGGKAAGDSSGGGGGRIAICENLTDEQMEQLFSREDHLADDVSVSPLTDKYGDRVSVAGAPKNGDRSDGQPGTAVYMINTAGRKTVEVKGDPENFGEATPSYGTHVYQLGETVPAEPPAGGYVDKSRRTRRTCVGYRLVDADTGDTVVSSDYGEPFEFTVSGNLTLTWDLSFLQHELAVEAFEGGSVVDESEDVAADGWVADGATVRLRAVPDEGFAFAGWFGDVVTNDQYASEIEFAQTRPHALKAVFVSSVAESATFTGAGDGTNWLDRANWSTGKIPGPLTDVTIPDKAKVTTTAGLRFAVKSLTVAKGATLTLRPEGSFSTRSYDPYTELTDELYEFHKVTLATSGDLAAEGAITIGRANGLAPASIEVGGAMTVASNVTVTVIGGWHGGITTASVAYWREYNGEVLVGGLLTVGGRLTLAGEGLSGSPVRVKAGKVKVLAGGRLDSDAGGWFWTTFHDGMPGCRAPGTKNINGNNYSGGAYGGGGGGHNTTTTHTTTTYGEAMRPYMPGSAGGNNGGANRGGGALRLEVDGRLVNDGRISADGSFGNGGSAGGGSGGSLWVTCQSIRMATNATIRVLGGNQSSSTTGAGGGGRLLVATRLSSEAIDALYETGALPASIRATVYDAQPDFVPGTVTAAGGVNSAWDAKNGEDGTVRWIEGPKNGLMLIVR